MIVFISIFKLWKIELEVMSAWLPTVRCVPKNKHRRYSHSRCWHRRNDRSLIVTLLKQYFAETNCWISAIYTSAMWLSAKSIFTLSHRWNFFSVFSLSQISVRYYIYVISILEWRSLSYYVYLLYKLLRGKNIKSEFWEEWRSEG
jgi:hypothetical protein